MKRCLGVILGAGMMVTVGCAANRHAEDVRKATQDGDRITVGTVQKEIRKGMSGAEVVAALGSPNIVSTDEQSREVWVYDKISTESVQSGSEGGIMLVVVGGSRSASASSTSQRTLTIVIKFDENKKVRDIAYHTTRF